MKMKATFKNCYGLEDFTLEEIKFDAQNSKAIIYAPNGVMKSSFSKVLDNISRKKKTVDRIFTEKKSEYTVEYYSSIYSDTSKLKKKDQPNIYVINSFDEKFEAYSDSVATILADDEIRKKYDDIHGAYSADIDSFINVFVSHTSLTQEQIRIQLCNDFDLNIDVDWETIIEKLLEKELEILPHGEFADIKYDQLFNTYTEKILTDPLFQEKIQKYIDIYEELVKRSNLLSLQFDDYNASEFGKTVEKTKLFSANHQILLSDGTVISDISAWNTLVKDEIQQINDTPELSSIHASISKMINGNAASRVLKDLIKDNKGIIKYLNNLSYAKKSIWMTYLNAESFNLNTLNTSIKTKKKEIDALLEEVDKQQAQWERVVDVFKKRFHAPFKVNIKNPRRVMLNDEPARLTFTYVRGAEEREKTKEELMECLSVGEKRALYLLQVLFDLEKIKDIADKTGQKQLVIADDIADSFDYSNKYAIIEYLSELSDNKMIDLLILTHNFDFYRTVSSRLDIKYNMCFVAQKEANGKIVMSKFQYKKDFFNVGIIEKIRPGELCDDELARTFISAIPFCRNVCEYTDNTDLQSFLTGMLHVKLNTDSITIADCWTKLKETFNLKDLDSPYATDKWIDLVFKMADNICTESAAGVSLTNKITLSIAIRLKAEFFLRNILVNNSIDIMCDAYQTRIWAKRAHSLLSDDEKVVISEVLLITPESIHVNAFMYEPLIDIPNYQLIELYQNCKLLGAKC
jgi:hypothetical protein